MKHSIDLSLSAYKRHLLGVTVYSGLVNLLMLNSSIYMLQIYDRVLVNRSVTTLLTLTALLVVVFLIQGLFDGTRQRLVVRIAHLFDVDLRHAAHATAIRSAATNRDPSMALQPIRDIDLVRNFLSGNGPIALLDLPWAPIFLVLVYIIHPWLGLLAFAGAAILVALTVAAEKHSRIAAKDVAALSTRQAMRIENDRRNAESILAMGLGASLRQRWSEGAERLAHQMERNIDVVGGYASASRIVRLLLQSLTLGLGSYLVIRNELSGGAIIASSIVVGRALAPIDMVIANWRGMLQSRAAIRRLETGLRDPSADSAGLELPPPTQRISLKDVSIGIPGGDTPILSGIQFELSAGDVLGVIGPSGAGKSSLVRTILGIWQPLKGAVRLDGATLDQWGHDRLGPHIGYVPQNVSLFDGTISENIARMQVDPPSEKVLSAAMIAGVHDLILKLPKGYDTQISEIGGPLSVGQRQRIALARAFYGDPFLIVLDEANANLDSVGEAALFNAISKAHERRAIVILVTHRQSVLKLCTKILILDESRQKAFGDAGDILKPQASVRAIQAAS